MGRGGAVLPAAQRLHGDRAAQRTRLLPVEPEAQALLTEHVLGTRGHRDCHPSREAAGTAGTPGVWEVNPRLPKPVV